MYENEFLLFAGMFKIDEFSPYFFSVVKMTVNSYNL